jgi:hypothetical protein
MSDEVRIMSRRIALLAVVGIVLAFGPAAVGQAFPLGLLPTSNEPVDAYVWTMESLFYVGDPIVIHLRVSRPSFVYLFDLQPDGVVRLLFPNAFSSNNFVASASHQLPDGSYDLIASPPTGIEELLVFASTVPLPFPPAAPTDPFPVFAENPEEAIDTLVGLLASMDPTLSWGVGWTAIQIEATAKDEGEPGSTMILPVPPPLPPFVSFPGDAWHRAHGSWAYGVPAAGWYWYYGLDDRWHLCWAFVG